MEWLAVGWAGFVGVVLALAFFWVFRSLGLTEFSPTLQVGCLFLRNPAHPGTDTLGFLLLLLAGSTIVPAAYAGILAAIASPSWWGGLLLGALHGLLAAALLPLIGTISACIRAGVVQAPGRFGMRWGWLTPVILVAGHACYGAVCGAILANL